MSEPRWTRTPWIASRTLVGGAPDHNRRTVIGHDDKHSQAQERSVCVLNRFMREWTVEDEANLTLILAADALYRQLEDAKATLEEAAKLLVAQYPSVANNIVNQCAIRCDDALAKAQGERGAGS